MTSEVLVTTETELLVEEGDSELLVETLIEREQLIEIEPELLIEEAPGDILVEQADPELLTAEVEVVELLEVGMQGPPGPRGPQGIQGESGVSTVGGYDVVIEDPQPGDVMALNSDLTWMNDKVLDGGNF